MCTNCNDCPPCGCDKKIPCTCIYHEGATLPTLNIKSGDDLCTIHGKVEDVITQLSQAVEEYVEGATDVTVESTDGTIEVTDNSSGNSFSFDLALAFANTTYTEDNTITTPITIAAEKVTGEDGKWKLVVKHKSTLPEKAHFYHTGTGYTNATADAQFTVAYEGLTAGGSATAGGATENQNKVLKIAKTITMNPYFRIALTTNVSDPLYNSSYSLKGYNGNLTNGSYVTIGTILNTNFLPDTTPAHGVLLHCKFTVHGTPNGGSIVKIDDPNFDDSQEPSLTLGYNRSSFDGLLQIINVSDTYTEIRFYNLETFNLALTTDNSVSIFSSSAISYNQV